MPEMDRRVLLKVGDGPEGIEIYTSEHGATIEMTSTLPTPQLPRNKRSTPQNTYKTG